MLKNRLRHSRRTLQPLVARLWGPGSGVSKRSQQLTEGFTLSEYSAYLSRLWRADERARTAHLPSLRVIIRAFLEYAGNCRCRIFRGVPFPALLLVAPYCVPGGVRVVSGGRGSGIAGSLVNQIRN